MGRVLCALALAAVTGGCAQIFGIDETDPYSKRITMVRSYAGATLVEEPMDLSAQTARFFVTDDTAASGLVIVPGTLDGTDSFFAELPADGGSIQFTVPDDTITRVWTHRARDQRGAYGILGRPGAEPAPANAQLDLAVTLDVPYAGEGLWFYDVGAWSYRIFTGAELPVATATAWDPAPIPYASVSSVTGRPLERIRAADSIWLLRYVGAVLSGAVNVPGFDQTDAADPIGTAAAPIVMLPVALDRTLMAMFATTAAGPRYTATTPAVSGIGMSWSLNAAPGTAIGVGTGPQLVNGVLTEADTGAVTAAHGNPFPWDMVLSFSTGESRTYTPPLPLMPFGLGAGMYSFQAPDPGVVFDLPQGLPLLVNLAGRALTTDGMTVTFDPTHAVDLSFVLDRAASCDLYQLSLDEFYDQGGGVVARRQRVAFSAEEPRWTVPGDLFAPNVMYTLRALCQRGGTPNFATGDLVTRTWPVHLGYLDSAVFTVTP